MDTKNYLNPRLVPHQGWYRWASEMLEELGPKETVKRLGAALQEQEEKIHHLTSRIATLEDESR